jgi:hypothetical protein
MSCACISTSIIMENDNEKLRIYIKKLEKKVEQYQIELLALYNSGSDYVGSYSSRDSSLDVSPVKKYRVLYAPTTPKNKQSFY